MSSVERAVVLAIDRYASSTLHSDRRAILLELSVRAHAAVSPRALAAAAAPPPPPPPPPRRLLPPLRTFLARRVRFRSC